MNKNESLGFFIIYLFTGSLGLTMFCFAKNVYGLIFVFISIIAFHNYKFLEIKKILEKNENKTKRQKSS